MDFRVCPIPVFEEFRSRCKRGNREVVHTSCWGEWYLAIHRGSENSELGIELINNLMTSRKVAERALSGAGLPLQRQFYEDYGEAICFGTDQTFNAIRQKCFKHARSRTEFFGFRVVARIMSGKLQAVMNNPETDVEQLVKEAFHTIDPDFS